MKWFNIDLDKVFELTGSSLKGLTLLAVKQKQLEHGPNALAGKKKVPAWKMFVSQFKDFMIMVLIIAAIVSGLVAEIVDTIVILIIVLLNAVLGFVQEYRAEKALDALKKMAVLNAVVIRDGVVSNVAAEELVVGDLVMLEAGNIIPADIRLYEAFGVTVDESCLTGESFAVNKNSDTLYDNDTPLGDRFNMVYRNTLVAGGRATGIVVAIGMNTEIGMIAGLLDGKESPTPLQLRMTDFSKRLSYLILFICIVLFSIGMLRGEEAVKMLLLSISLAVAAIPEALPALITIALAQGANRMVRKNALIRKLHAVETIGSVSFICTDKTGTLTLNKMTVVEIEENKKSMDEISGLTIFKLSMALSHDAKLNQQKLWTGDPTEIALVEHISRSQTIERVIELQEKYKRVAELPFDSDRKCMTTVHRFENGLLVITKGAGEVLASKLSLESERNYLVSKVNLLAKKGMRVIAYGYRILPEEPQPLNIDSIEKELMFSGLAGMIDPPRPEVKLAIQECKSAGIQTVMITGDHPETAAAIAKEIGILYGNQMVITGSELQKMPMEIFDEKVEKISVYARVTPEQKLIIVNALQRKNYFIAMTGDGVNDAPALKTANIGIAMGINGSDVSKEAAHMILLDDNFSTIVKAIKEGRRIYDNIRKFVKYIMTCNSAEILTIFLAPLFGLPIPLLPIHILWINLVTDGLPGLALAGEKAERNIMSRPPRGRDESLFSGGISFHIIWVGILMAGVTVAVQAWAYHTGKPNWQTMVFTVLTFSQIGHVLAIRSECELFYKQRILSNLPLLIAVVLTILIQLSVIYLPAANSIFRTQPLSLMDLLICVGLSAIVFHAVEFEKWMKFRKMVRVS